MQTGEALAQKSLALIKVKSLLKISFSQLIFVFTFVLVDRCLVIDGELSVRVDADTDISDISVNLPRLVSENLNLNSIQF